MRELLGRLQVLAWVAAICVGLPALSFAQDDWGDSPRDEQQWWNPGDWFDNTEDPWDYNHTWNDMDWFGADDGVGSPGDGLDYDYGTSDYDYDDFDNNYEGADDYWYDDFSYDYDYDYGL